jgi:phosphatidylglycerol:prolipoprotein diacylglycerol transferase
MGDVVAPGVALGYAIGRVGCFLNGCCYGGPTDLPWACRFHDPPITGPLTPPSHPTQIYASIINLGVFYLLLRIFRRQRVTGQVLWSYIVFYAVYRFGIEFLRAGVTAQVAAAGLTQAQWASIGMLLAGGAVLFWLSRHGEGVQAYKHSGAPVLPTSGKPPRTPEHLNT